MTASDARVTRDFTVAVFVVHEGCVLLHRHSKLGRWLPPGGHIEQNELPDDAARREVLEEAGIAVELLGERGLAADYPGQPLQLIRPAGIQLEPISPGHEHIDLVYFARVATPVDASAFPPLSQGFRWVSVHEVQDLPVTEEILAWCERAVSTVAPRPA